MTDVIITASAQQSDRQQVRIGIAAGANYNYVEASAQQFIGNTGDASFSTSDFSDGTGPGIYAGIVAGVHLRGTFDERCVSQTAGSAELTSHLIYASIEPAVRINLSAPLRLHMLAGPSVSFPINAQFDYNGSQSESGRDMESVEMNNVNDVVFGGWVGFGMDISLGQANGSWFVTPFVEGSYVYDQKEADIRPAGFDNVWSTISGRAGVQLKLGL
jgi:hypothetical protein